MNREVCMGAPRFLKLSIPFCIAIVSLAGFNARSARAEEPGKFTIDVLVRGTRLEGTPLAWSENLVFLLGRDGRLWDFAPNEAQDYRKTASEFRPYTANMLRARLESELGRAYEVSGTGHFLVAYPRGQKEQWAERFEEMYRSFIAYFSVRGFRLQQPPFPLVAIVWSSKEDFQRYTMRDGLKPTSDLLGYYSLDTNRVTLFDVGDGRANSADWQRNYSTVIHEAAHQTAFNTGIHNRFAPPPRWVAEGLGTLFEARGVNNSRAYTNQSDRINRERLEQFRQYRASRRKPDSLMQLIASDRAFDRDAMAAYGEAWMLTFYLVETLPREYAQYLARTANRPAFTEYTAAARLADFTAVFGSDFRMIEARFSRFVDSLR
jgi:hypothetical protein